MATTVGIGGWSCLEVTHSRAPDAGLRLVGRPRRCPIPMQPRIPDRQQARWTRPRRKFGCRTGQVEMSVGPSTVRCRCEPDNGAIDAAGWGGQAPLVPELGCVLSPGLIARDQVPCSMQATAKWYEARHDGRFMRRVGTNVKWLGGSGTVPSRCPHSSQQTRACGDPGTFLPNGNLAPCTPDALGACNPHSLEPGW